MALTLTHKIRTNKTHSLHFEIPSLICCCVIHKAASLFLGEIVNIQHMEPVGWNHFAHSYVRGNWRREEDTGSSLLAKCCHDIDLLNSFMGPSKCISVSSFGSLNHFKKSNKPEGAGERCTDCSIEAKCPYSAVKMYLTPAKLGFPNYFCSVVADNPTPEEIEKSLKTGPYGRCVYDCDNDVMSNQVVNMIFEGGKTVNMSMIAFTEKLCVRQTKIFGTHGEMTCSETSPITVFDFATERRQTFYAAGMPTEGTTMRGHGCADYHLMKAFVKAVAFEDPNMILSGPDESLDSHRLVFLAEVARKENRVVDVHATGN